VFVVKLEDAKKQFPEFSFVSALTPSAQKAAFHVKDKNGKDLCLKIISPSTETDRLQREIAALREIVHPNVARFVQYEFSSKNGVNRHYLIEEFVEGSDLTPMLGKPWPTKKCAAFFIELANGLGAIHAKQIVHRDLKPSNVRVTKAGNPVIIDFGLARHLTLPDLTKTVQGAGIGTPMFFAPEQFKGNKRDIDQRTDLFAFGVILHWAAVGEHPFLVCKPANLGELEAAICGSEDYLKIAAFNKVPGELQTLLRWLLGKRRSDRPLDCKQVITALTKIA
jgi:serine/threonine-protein kinase